MTPPPIAAVVLAAGASTRLGRPKQTLRLAGETLLARALRTATAADLSPLVAVVPPALDLADSLTQHPHAHLLRNPDAAEGIAASIRCAIQSLTRSAESVPAAPPLLAPPLAGVVLLTCDQVLLSATHLRALCADPTRLTGSRYAGRTGVPAYVPASSFPALLALRGDAGARALLTHAASIPCEDLALDIDTEADLATALVRLGLPSTRETNE